MQHANRSKRKGKGAAPSIAASVRNASTRHCEAQGGCYGVQILVAGRRKSWRDSVSAQVRRAGFNATTVDSAVDALAVLALGLPIDVLLTDIDLHGELDCSQLACEARALRPNLGIVLASELEGAEADLVPDALVLAPEAYDGLESVVREALASRAA